MTTPSNFLRSFLAVSRTYGVKKACTVVAKSGRSYRASLPQKPGYSYRKLKPSHSNLPKSYSRAYHGTCKSHVIDQVFRGVLDAFSKRKDDGVNGTVGQGPFFITNDLDEAKLYASARAVSIDPAVVLEVQYNTDHSFIHTGMDTKYVIPGTQDRAVFIKGIYEMDLDEANAYRKAVEDWPSIIQQIVKIQALATEELTSMLPQASYTPQDV